MNKEMANYCMDMLASIKPLLQQARSLGLQFVASRAAINALEQTEHAEKEVVIANLTPEAPRLDIVNTYEWYDGPIAFLSYSRQDQKHYFSLLVDCATYAHCEVSFAEIVQIESGEQELRSFLAGKTILEEKYEGDSEAEFCMRPISDDELPGADIYIEHPRGYFKKGQGAAQSSSSCDNQTKDPAWKQDSPLMQLKAILSSLEGDVSNMDDGINPHGCISRIEQRIDELRLLTSHLKKDSNQWHAI